MILDVHSFWRCGTNPALADGNVVAHNILSCPVGLCLHEKAEAPLPYQQLTRLQLFSSHHNATDVLTMTSNLPLLQELELHLDLTFDLFVLDAAALSQWPQLRLLDLSGSRLWDSDPGQPDPRHPQDQRCAPMRQVERLMHLQRACPRIEWVLRTAGQRG